jgi:hypothetical protein
MNRNLIGLIIKAFRIDGNGLRSRLNRPLVPRSRRLLEIMLKIINGDEYVLKKTYISRNVEQIQITGLQSVIAISITNTQLLSPSLKLINNSILMVF